MTTLRELAENAALEEMVARQFAAIPKPDAPECAQADPAPSEAVENFAGLVAAAGLICLFFGA